LTAEPSSKSNGEIRPEPASTVDEIGNNHPTGVCTRIFQKEYRDGLDYSPNGFSITPYIFSSGYAFVGTILLNNRSISEP
jgi:hypothetical protein